MLRWVNYFWMISSIVFVLFEDVANLGYANIEMESINCLFKFDR